MQVDDNGGAGTIHFLYTDHLMTARLATDQNQTITWRWDGEAFGGGEPVESGAVVNLRFPGQYFDFETGLYYNYYRYYDPSTGRYITSDPIGLDGGLNTYGYVGGNPIAQIDFFGLDWKFVGWTIKKNEAWTLSWFWSNWVNIYALCENKECDKKYKEVLAHSWQTRPMCIGEPACFDGGPTISGGSIINSAFDLYSDIQHARKCGSMSGYQCFLSTATWEDGQKFCGKLSK